MASIAAVYPVVIEFPAVRGMALGTLFIIVIFGCIIAVAVNTIRGSIFFMIEIRRRPAIRVMANGALSAKMIVGGIIAVAVQAIRSVDDAMIEIHTPPTASVVTI